MTSLKSELLIDPSIIQENILFIKNLMPKDSKFMAVIKSDAYGHIMENLIKTIDNHVDGYGTVRIEEAIRIRNKSNKKILLMTGVYSNKDLEVAKKHNFDLVVHNQNQFNLIQENDYYKNLWFKVNTGMNRLGFEEQHFIDIYNKNDIELEKKNYEKFENINDILLKKELYKLDTSKKKFELNSEVDKLKSEVIILNKSKSEPNAF